MYHIGLHKLSCFLYHKVTKLKANHNCLFVVLTIGVAVSYITKLLNWKQITTVWWVRAVTLRCFLYHKVTKLKANHNHLLQSNLHFVAVSYITKLLNWKQITTNFPIFSKNIGCFLYHKVTKLKANHNQVK